MALEKEFLLLFVVVVFISVSIAWNNRSPGQSYVKQEQGDEKVRDFGKRIGDQMKDHESNTLWERGKLSAGKGGVGYSFDNGAKAFVGKNGIGYDFGARNKLSFKPTDLGAGKKLPLNPTDWEMRYRSNNGAEVFNRLKDDALTIKCYECNGCGDPFTERGTTHCEGLQCYKSTALSDNDAIGIKEGNVDRGCRSLTVDVNLNTCQDLTTDKGTKVNTCLCTTDLCNGSNVLNGSGITKVIIIIGINAAIATWKIILL